MQHKVSVITPSYNQGRFIERTIQSVLTQRFPGSLEYLVLDGGSTDQTVEILQKYGSQLRWVSEPDHGQADAVNKGLVQASGDIIGWLNSDDVYYPEAIAAACKALDAHPEIDVVYGDANHIDEKDGIMDAYPTESWSFDHLLETCYICQPAVFFRRSVLERCGMLNAKLQYCLDYEYWIRLASSGLQFLWLRQVLAGSRLYPETKTLGSRVQCHKEINDMMRQSLGRVPDRWLSNYAHAVLDERRIARSESIYFPLLVSTLCTFAALRWNREVSPDMRRMTATWTGTALRRCYRGLFSQ